MGLIIFLTAITFYGYTLVPVIFFEDNPELITSAYTLGISHPSGYPLINILGNMAGMAPFGNFAFRCNMLSAFFGAIALLFFYRCAISLTKDKWLSGAATFVLMFSGNFWSQSIIFEVYTLHYAFFFLILWIALSKRLKDFRWLLFSSFLFGMAVTNHLSFALTLVPFTLLWLSNKDDWHYKMNIKKWFFLLGAGLMSWGIQLYLVARSLAKSNSIFFSWGKVDTPELFWGNITGSIYSKLPFNKGAVEERMDTVTNYILGIPTALWVVIALLVGIGFLRMLSENKWLLRAFISAMVLLAGYTFIQYAAIDILMVLPWSLVLLSIIYGLSGATRWQGRVAGFIFLAVPFAFLNVNYPALDRHNDFSAYNYAIDILDTVPEKGHLKLLPGFTENYIFIFFQDGPAGNGKIKRSKRGFAFYPYLLPDRKKSFRYGLLNTTKEGLNFSETDDIWKHIRSLNIDKSLNDAKGGYLTRDVYKSAVLSRIALQKGMALRDKGKHAEADDLFGHAAYLSPTNTLREAAIREKGGETKLAILLLEKVMEHHPSAHASALLARLALIQSKKRR